MQRFLAFLVRFCGKVHLDYFGDKVTRALKDVLPIGITARKTLRNQIKGSTIEWKLRW